MISGAHIVIDSSDPEADRAFLRDVFEFPNVDVGGGWLIFALPPAEVAVHPAAQSGKHELYFMCEDIDAFRSQARDKGVECGDIEEQPWGRLTAFSLPGGGEVGVYQPHHELPPR